MGSLSHSDLLPRPHLERGYLTICICKGRSRAPFLFPRALVFARLLCQPAVLSNTASNLPHRPFPGISQVKLALGWAQGRRQTPARGRGMRRSETSYFCQLPATKSIALCNFALPAPGEWKAGRGMLGVAEGARSNSGSSLLLPVPGKEKLKIFFPAGKFG